MDGNLQNLHADTAFFETFILERVTHPLCLSSQMANMSLKNDILVCLSNYLKFPGRQVDWSKFNKHFKAMPGLAGLKELLGK